MSILIEGIDRCGKTTLATALRRAMKGWAYAGNTRPRQDPYTYFSRLVAYSSAEVIYDRMHLSDVAYQAALRPNTEVLSPREFQLMELMLMSRGTILTYVDDDVTDILSRWDDKEMFKVNLEDLERLRNEFLSAFERSRLHRVVIDNINGYVDLNHNQLRPSGTALGNTAYRAFNAVYRYAPMPAIGIGSPFGFMIVGESVNDNVAVKTYHAQAPFSCGPASEFLWNCLEEAGIPWWRGYYTNADDWSATTLTEFIHHWRPRAVVAAGNAARELVSNFTNGRTIKLNHHGFDSPGHYVRCTAIQHPQYAKRFGGCLAEAKAAYVEQLKVAIQYDPETMGEDITWNNIV